MPAQVHAGPAFLVLTPDGSMVDMQFSLDEAIQSAYDLDPSGNIYVDAPSDEDYGFIAASLPDVNLRHALAANPPSPDNGQSIRLAVRSLANAMGRHPDAIFDFDAAMEMSLQEAYERLLPLMPTHKTFATGRIQEMSSTPSAMALKFLGQNYKTSKETPQSAIKKLKSMTGFRAAKVLGLSLLPNTQSFANAGVQQILSKSSKFGLAQVRPTKLNSCARATAECASSCLSFAGHNLTDDYNVASKFGTTQALVHEPEAFLRMLVEAISRHFALSMKNEVMPLVRLNVLSDIPWEEILPDLFEMFPGVQFYDYTKIPGRETPENYDLTFSFSGTARNTDEMDREIREFGRRVAIVFAATAIKELYEVTYEIGGIQRTIRTPQRSTAKQRAERAGVEFEKLGVFEVPHLVKYRRRKPGAIGKSEKYAKLPTTFLGLPLVDGDVSDMRPYDPTPSIVGLRWKIPALQGVTMEQVKLFVVKVHLVPSGGGHFHAVVAKTPRFDGVNYAMYHGA